MTNVTAPISALESACHACYADYLDLYQRYTAIVASEGNTDEVWRLMEAARVRWTERLGHDLYYLLRSAARTAVQG